MTVDEVHPTRAEERIQFRLRSLFLFVTFAAAVCALVHYHGGIVLFWLTLVIFVFIFLFFGSALFAESLVFAIDTSSALVAATTRMLRKRLRR